MEKRGQSGIIVAVLIILIVIIAVIIVWNVVMPIVQKSSKEASVNPFLLGGGFVYSVAPDNKSISINVTRDNQAGNIKGVRLVLEDRNGTTYIYHNTTITPKILEKVTYSVKSDKFGISNFSNVIKISLYFSYMEQGQEKYSTRLDSQNVVPKS